MQTIGTNIRYAASGSHIGLTAITYDFGHHTVEPPAKPYNRYLFHGNRNVNASVDYMFRINTLKWYGETAFVAQWRLGDPERTAMDTFLLRQGNHSLPKRLPHPFKAGEHNL